MVWLFNQNGSFSSGDGKVAVPAYSGFPPYKNDPGAEEMIGLGPIPRGTYVCGQPEDSESLGPHVISLTPTKWTATHGRAGFFIHGDSVAHAGLASHGCVILDRATRSLIQPNDLLVVWA